MLRRVTESFVGAEWARVSSFIAIFATATIFQFSPGRIDHDGLELVFALTAIWTFLRMANEPASLKWPVLGGFVLALAMAVALEILPVLLLMVTWIGFWAAVKGGRASYAGVIFGASLVIASSGFLLLTRSSTHLFDVDILAYSVVYVLMAAGAFVCFAGVTAVSWVHSAIVRCAVGGALAAGLGIAFLHYFPALKTGPYGAMDPALSKLMLNNITEAVPMLNKDMSVTSLLFRLLWPLMGIVTAVYFLWKERKQNLWAWGLLTLVIMATGALAAFYQVRFITMEQVFAVPALVALLRAGLAAAERKYSGCLLCAMRVGMVLLVGPLPMVLLPALFDGRTFNPGVLLFPNQSSGERPCDLQVISDMLAMPSYYGDRPRVIMNMIDHGPELMFRTPHKVLAAPYHLNVSGNLDAVKFFSATNAEDAHAIARSRDVDLVVMCKIYADLYSIRGEKNKVTMDEKGKIESNDASFSRQLADDKVPDWLKPVDYPLFGNMLLFEVREKFLPSHPDAQPAPQKPGHKAK